MNKLFGYEILGLALTAILLTTSTVNAGDGTSAKGDGDWSGPGAAIGGEEAPRGIYSENSQFDEGSTGWVADESVKESVKHACDEKEKGSGCFRK